MQLSAELYLILAILSSASMAIALKIFQGGEGNRYAILLGNYLTCVLLAFALLPEKTVFFRMERATLICGCIGGLFFVTALVGMQSSVRVNGAILTAAFSRLGLLVPLLISIFVFGEKPGGWQIAGLVCVFAAMWLIGGKEESQAGIRFALLLFVLIFCGSGDAMAKIFEHTGKSEQDALYIFFVFLTAAILTLLLLIREYRVTGKRTAMRDMAAGIAVGIPNYFSSLMLLKALEKLPAILVYPVFSTGAILVVTLLGALLFGERPGKRQWIALGIILAALVLLNI